MINWRKYIIIFLLPLVSTVLSCKKKNEIQSNLNDVKGITVEQNKDVKGIDSLQNCIELGSGCSDVAIENPKARVAT